MIPMVKRCANTQSRYQPRKVLAKNRLLKSYFHFFRRVLDCVAYPFMCCLPVLCWNPIICIANHDNSSDDESMQKNESGGLSLSLLLSKITFNFSLWVNVYEFILNYVKLFPPRSDKLVFGDKRLHQQNCRKTIMVPCLTKHNS